MTVTRKTIGLAALGAKPDDAAGKTGAGKSARQK
jgi:hypothetical protein